MTAKWRLRRGASHRRADPGHDLTDIDPDMFEMLQTVSVELSGELHALIASRVNVLIRRRTPLRVVESAMSVHAVRLRFADGTTLIVHGAHAGDAGLLAARLLFGAVTAARCEVGVDGIRLQLACAQRPKRLWVDVLGLDQPD